MALTDDTLVERLEEQFEALELNILTDATHGEVTVEVAPEHYLTLCTELRQRPQFQMEQVIDLCGVDYSSYGEESGAPWQGQRYAVVLHLISYRLQERLRLRVFLDNDEFPLLPSVSEIWQGANWYEREAFDLLGIVFEGHPDLRRILTDYGFVGHPLRKDFPMVGHVEMRYDEVQGRVIYEPVAIEERVNVPRVARKDNRYV